MAILMAIFLMTRLMMDTGSGKASQPLQPVPVIDLARYAGTWYEIGRFENRFQRNCAGEVTASYTLLAGSKVRVVNSCRRQNGMLMSAEAVARLANPAGPSSKLKVRFAPAWLSWLPPVWADYWVIDLADDYSYAVVGTPDRDYLWILSRVPQMDERLYQRIAARAEQKGFDVSWLLRTRQAGTRAE